MVCAAGRVDSCIYFGIAACRSCHFQSRDVSRAVGVGGDAVPGRGCCSATSSTTVAERRRWAWVGVVTGTRKTHIITFLWTCCDVFSRGYYDAFATARAGCSAGGEWLLSPEGTAQAEFFCAFHFIVEPVGGCCCVSVIEGPGVTCKLTRHMTAAPILRYFRSMPQVVRPAAAPGWTAARRRRSVVIIAAGPSVVNEACKT